VEIKVRRILRKYMKKYTKEMLWADKPLIKNLYVYILKYKNSIKIINNKTVVHDMYDNDFEYRGNDNWRFIRKE